MNPSEKINLILKFSELTQQELANRLGVTFAALNRWANGKALPRKGAQAKIDELYLEYSGEKQIPSTALEAKKAAVFQKQKKHKNAVKEIIVNPDIRDEFFLALTFNSNRIEGSTLSEGETASILFQNATLPDKSLIEQLEVKNHKAALEYLFNYIGSKKILDEKLILRLHAILMNAIRQDSGAYRSHPVRIVGANLPTANYMKVPILMKKLLSDIKKQKKDTFGHVARIHSDFEKIHPFSDGNGRVGRLLIHAMLLRANFPPAVISAKKRRLYITHLNKAQVKNDASLLESFICDATMDGYKILERK